MSLRTANTAAACVTPATFAHARVTGAPSKAGITPPNLRKTT
ncbi:hypothetical protein [Immundisolibacter sp.]